MYVRVLPALFLWLAATLVSAQQNLIVLVGSTSDAPGGIFQFIPPSLNVTNGTTVTFRFTGAPGNHSVTQSTFSNPCNPLVGGFDSGWVLIPTNNVSTSPEWNLTVTNTSIPLWFFCKQLVPTPHCAAGMVGAINAPGSGNLSFSAFVANAKSFTGPSGQGEGSLVGIGASASAGPGPSVSGAQFFTAAPATSATSPSSPNSTSSASGGGSNGTSMASGNLLVVIFSLFIGSVLCSLTTM